MPGRTLPTGGGYRYGFNGKEKDDEVKGNDNQQDYGMRIYDPRVGRFLSVDPISRSYPMLTPYQFASNSPISGSDLDGLEYKVEIKSGEVVLNVKLVVINSTDVLSKAELIQIGNNIKKDFESNYSKPAITIIIGGLPITLPKITAKATIETLNGIKASPDVSKSITTVLSTANSRGYALVMQSLDKKVPEDALTSEGGHTPDIELKSQSNVITVNVAMNGNARNNSDIGRTIQHELGHNAGLRHSWEETNIVELKQTTKAEMRVNRTSILNNLMNSMANPKDKLKSSTGVRLTYGQVYRAVQNIINEQKEYFKQLGTLLQGVIF